MTSSWMPLAYDVVFTLLMLKPDPDKLVQYLGYRCPGSLSYQVISTHGITGGVPTYH